MFCARHHQLFVPKNTKHNITHPKPLPPITQLYHPIHNPENHINQSQQLRHASGLHQAAEDGATWSGSTSECAQWSEPDEWQRNAQQQWQWSI